MDRNCFAAVIQFSLCYASTIHKNLRIFWNNFAAYVLVDGILHIWIRDKMIEYSAKVFRAGKSNYNTQE